MSCNCSRFIDIRGRCLHNINRKEWNRCKAKTDTAYWLISNERDIYIYIYNLIEEYGFDTDKVCTAVKEKFYITDEDWRNIIEIYKKENLNSCC